MNARATGEARRTVEMNGLNSRSNNSNNKSNGNNHHDLQHVPNSNHHNHQFSCKRQTTIDSASDRSESQQVEQMLLQLLHSQQNQVPLMLQQVIEFVQTRTDFGRKHDLKQIERFVNQLVDKKSSSISMPQSQINCNQSRLGSVINSTEATQVNLLKGKSNHENVKQHPFPSNGCTFNSSANNNNNCSSSSSSRQQKMTNQSNDWKIASKCADPCLSFTAHNAVNLNHHNNFKRNTSSQYGVHDNNIAYREGEKSFKIGETKSQVNQYESVGCHGAFNQGKLYASNVHAHCNNVSKMNLRNEKQASDCQSCPVNNLQIHHSCANCTSYANSFNSNQHRPIPKSQASFKSTDADEATNVNDDCRINNQHFNESLNSSDATRVASQSRNHANKFESNVNSITTNEASSLNCIAFARKQVNSNVRSVRDDPSHWVTFESDFKSVAHSVEQNKTDEVNDEAAAMTQQEQRSSKAALLGANDSSEFTVNGGQVKDKQDKVLYEWCQNLNEIELSIRLMKTIQNANQVRVFIRTHDLTILMNSNGNWENKVNGRLRYPIRPDGSYWQLDRDRNRLFVCLEKLQPQWWTSVLEGEQSIDLNRIPKAVALHELSDDQQAVVHRLMEKQRLQQSNRKEVNAFQNGFD